MADVVSVALGYLVEELRQLPATFFKPDRVLSSRQWVKDGITVVAKKTHYSGLNSKPMLLGFTISITATDVDDGVTAWVENPQFDSYEPNRRAVIAAIEHIKANVTTQDTRQEDALNHL